MKNKKTKYFYVYIILGVLLLLASAILAPVWKEAGDWAFFKTWGQDILNIIIAASLIAYLFFYLSRKLKNYSDKVNLILVLVEFVVICILVVGLLLSQFKLINVGGACETLGLVLWLRGVVKIISAYYYKNAEKGRYSIYSLAIAIAFVTFGTWCFVKPFITDLVILWIFVVVVALYGAFLLIYGILSKPEKIKKAKQQKNIKRENQTIENKKDNKKDTK